MEHKDHRARRMVDKMLKKDYFSQWLKLQIIAVREGYCQTRMSVRREMLNGFGILHGGISYALADSTFAFASNTYGRLSVALKVSMSYAKSVRRGEVLYAEAKQEHLGNRTAIYRIYIRNEKEELVAIFDGTVYRTEKRILDEEE